MKRFKIKTILVIVTLFITVGISSAFIGLPSIVRDRVEDMDEKVKDVAFTVSITNPSDAATIYGVVNIEVDVKSENEIDKVEFYINETLRGLVTSSPYKISWTTWKEAAAFYTIKVKVYDSDGRTAEDRIAVEVIVPELPYIEFEGEKLYIHPVDNSNSTQWGGQGEQIGAEAQSSTRGWANTQAIVEFHDSLYTDDENETGYYDYDGDFGEASLWTDGVNAYTFSSDNDGTVAAKLIDDLEDEYMGYEDWYLPAKDQLEAIYLAWDAGDIEKGFFADDWKPFAPSWYWSSTEYGSINAYNVSFTNGTVDTNQKSNDNFVRAVRSSQ